MDTGEKGVRLIKAGLLVFMLAVITLSIIWVRMLFSNAYSNPVDKCITIVDKEIQDNHHTSVIPVGGLLFPMSRSGTDYVIHATDGEDSFSFDVSKAVYEQVIVGVEYKAVVYYHDNVIFTAEFKTELVESTK